MTLLNLSTPIEDTPLDNLEMSVRSAYCFKNWGLRTVGDVTALTEAEIMRIPNFGRRSLAEIKRVLGELGLHLRGDTLPPPPITPVPDFEREMNNAIRRYRTAKEAYITSVLEVQRIATAMGHYAADVLGKTGGAG